MGSQLIHLSKDTDEWLEYLLTHYIVARDDMNKLIMDYFVTEGFKESAEKFHIESGTPHNTDLDSLDDKVKIREAIEAGNIEAGLMLINKYSEFLDNEPYLFFHLQQQQLIELIRNKKVEDALVFAQNNLAEYGENNADVLDELEKTLALLAFDEPEKSPFGDLLSQCHRQKVASEVITSLSKFENIPSESRLSHVLKLLLWSQQELSDKKIPYPKMTDLSGGKILLNASEAKPPPDNK